MIKIFSYLFSKRKTTLVIIDVLVITISMISSAILLLGPGEGLLYLRANLLSFVIMSLTFLFLFYVSDIYNCTKLAYDTEEIITIIIAALLSLPVSALLIYLFNLVMIGRKVFILNGIIAIFGVLLFRKILDKLTDKPLFKIKTAAIGINDNLIGNIQKLLKEKKLGIEIIKLHYNDFKHLETQIRDKKIEQIITADYKLSDKLIYSLSSLILEGVKIYDIPLFFQEYFHKIPIDYISNKWLYNEFKKKKPYASYIKNIKQIMDMALASIGLAFFLPLCIPIIIAIKLTSKGPVFYRQERLGKNGRSFSVVKFRTMIDNAEGKTGVVWCKKNDDRITIIGKFLRASRLDELPQLYNILKGEMSLIGPRPERQEFIKYFINKNPPLKNNYLEEDYIKKIPYYTIRLLVKPGLTGWAQVNNGYANSNNGTKEKLEYELYYILNQSILLDLSILFKTISIVLLSKGV